MPVPPSDLLRAVERFRPQARDAGWHSGRGAWAACLRAAQAFAEHCRAQGIPARTYGSWASELLAGYGAAPGALNDGHVVTLLDGFDVIWTVDWTAAQFGIRDPWPVIRAWPDGMPTRPDPWLLTADEAAEHMRQLRAHLDAGGSLI